MSIDKFDTYNNAVNECVEVVEEPRPRGQRLERPVYDKLLESFREDPKGFVRAARYAGVTRPTAVRAWEVGWPDRYMRPIKEIIEEDMIIARGERAKAVMDAASDDAAVKTEQDLVAAMHQNQLALRAQAITEERARLQARDDAIMVRRDEGMMVQMCRRTIISTMASASKLTNIAVDKAQQLEKQVDAGDVDMSPHQTINFVRTCANIAKTTTEAAKMAMEMERLLMGAPTEIIGVELSAVSMTDAARTIEMAHAALQRAKERGVINDDGTFTAEFVEDVDDVDGEIPL